MASSTPVRPAYVEPAEPIDGDEIPDDVPTLHLEVDAAALQSLDADPFDAADVSGTFIDAAETTYPDIEVNYRGAYQLQNLLSSGASQRNWKLKFSKDNKYRSRREWNFNYEPHLRQKVTYDLMRFAGVKVPQAQHVLLVVNGEEQGLYLQYEDPDNKDWLRDKFGDDSGDLYKAATDLPGQEPFFATTEYLGEADEDYFLHYNKKTNNDLLPADYSALRGFLQGLNATADSELQAWFEHNFDVTKFIAYLVVDNFVSGWDGLPQRPKNYWLYELPAAERWVFVPWDLDATFQVQESGLNPMGTDASVYYQFDEHEPYQLSRGEGTARPLVRRMLGIAAFRAAYLREYERALGSFLEPSRLVGRINTLQAQLEAYANDSDRETVRETSDEMREFIDARFSHVTAELAELAQ